MTTQETSLATATIASNRWGQQAENTARVGIVWRNRHLVMLLCDCLVVIGAFLLSYNFRFYHQFLALKTVQPPGIGMYVRGGFILSLVWVIRLWRDGNYERGLRGLASTGLRLKSLLANGCYALSALMVISFLYREMLLSRQVYLTTAVFAFAGMVTTRAVMRRVDRYLARRGYAATTVAIVGTSPLAREFAEVIERADNLVRIVGYFSVDGERYEPSDEEGRFLGNESDIRSAYAVTRFDKLVLASPALALKTADGPDATVTELLNFCEEEGIALYLIPGTFDVSVSPQEIATFSGTPLIQLKDASLHPGYAVVKRIFDACAAGAVLFLCLPVLVGVALAIKLTSKGPVLFTQVRAGRHGKPFKMYKFRSMAADAEARLADVVDLDGLAEPVFKVRNDPRVTPIGRILRRTGIDEIPQLLNVLKGEMSLVGPRPEELRLVERYGPLHRRRLKGKPGITGYQQIMNRGEASLSKRVQHDLLYLKHQSLTLDLYIMARTLEVVVRGTGITH